uniref:Uncharacterized protein n=1 Tax=Timema bartmani TaxID=61472 RepID=A0A7R9I4I6_9NEOP|nr:unnamed protein product [Timema bartmani]
MLKLSSPTYNGLSIGLACSWGDAMELKIEWETPELPHLKERLIYKITAGIENELFTLREMLERDKFPESARDDSKNTNAGESKPTHVPSCRCPRDWPILRHFQPCESEQGKLIVTAQSPDLGFILSELIREGAHSIRGTQDPPAAITQADTLATSPFTRCGFNSPPSLGVVQLEVKCGFISSNKELERRLNKLEQLYHKIECKQHSVMLEMEWVHSSWRYYHTLYPLKTIHCPIYTRSATATRPPVRVVDSGVSVLACPGVGLRAQAGRHVRGWVSESSVRVTWSIVVSCAGHVEACSFSADHDITKGDISNWCMWGGMLVDVLVPTVSSPVSMLPHNYGLSSIISVIPGHDLEAGTHDGNKHALGSDGALTCKMLVVRTGGRKEVFTTPFSFIQDMIWRLEHRMGIVSGLLERSFVVEVLVHSPKRLMVYGFLYQPQVLMAEDLLWQLNVLMVANILYQPNMLMVEKLSWQPKMLMVENLSWQPKMLMVENLSWEPKMLMVENLSWQPKMLMVENLS